MMFRLHRFDCCTSWYRPTRNVVWPLPPVHTKQATSARNMLRCFRLTRQVLKLLSFLSMSGQNETHFRTTLAAVTLAANFVFVAFQGSVKNAYKNVLWVWPPVKCRGQLNALHSPGVDPFKNFKYVHNKCVTDIGFPADNLFITWLKLHESGTSETEDDGRQASLELYTHTLQVEYAHKSLASLCTPNVTIEYQLINFSLNSFS